MNPMYGRRVIPWGTIGQFTVIIIVALLLIRFISTNFVGILFGVIAGSVITARHYNRKIAQAQVWNESGPDSVYYQAGGYPGAGYGQHPSGPLPAQRRALTSGRQARRQPRPGYQDQGYPQPGYHDQGYPDQAYADQGDYPDYYDQQGQPGHYGPEGYFDQHGQQYPGQDQY